MATKSINYVSRLKIIRPYVNFDYNLNDVKKLGLSPSAKREISTYFKEITRLKKRGVVAYKPRGINKEKRLSQAQQFGQHTKKLKFLKVAFIPSDGKNKPKLVFNKNNQLKKVKLTDKITSQFLPFDPVALINNPKQHTEDVIRQTKYKSFQMVVAGTEVNQVYLRRSIAEEVEKFVQQYKAKDFLTGLMGYSFRNQKSIKNYITNKRKFKKNTKKRK